MDCNVIGRRCVYSVMDLSAIIVIDVLVVLIFRLVWIDVCLSVLYCILENTINNFYYSSGRFTKTNLIVCKMVYLFKMSAANIQIKGTYVTLVNYRANKAKSLLKLPKRNLRLTWEYLIKKYRESNNELSRQGNEKTFIGRILYNLPKSRRVQWDQRMVLK